MHVEIILSVFGFILTILGTLLIGYFKDLKADVKNMSTSIIELNIKLERVILDQTWHKEEIALIKEQINGLQKER